MDRLLEFSMNHPALVGAGVALVLALAWNLRKTASGRGLTAAQSVQIINREGGIPIDIRAEGAFRGGHIINAVRLDPAQLETDLRKLEKHRDRPLLVYCESGISSAKVATRLRAAGFGRVYELQGGLAAWRGENFPLESSR